MNYERTEMVHSQINGEELRVFVRPFPIVAPNLGVVVHDGESAEAF
jgi:hypothetical protein